jgi:hypothetical protein
MRGRVARIPSDGHFALRSFPAGTGNSSRSEAVSRNARSSRQHLERTPRARKSVRQKMASKRWSAPDFPRGKRGAIQRRFETLVPLRVCGQERLGEGVRVPGDGF